jgi:hypothetical protein
MTNDLRTWITLVEALDPKPKPKGPPGNPWKRFGSTVVSNIPPKVQPQKKGAERRFDLLMGALRGILRFNLEGRPRLDNDARFLIHRGYMILRRVGREMHVGIRDPNRYDSAQPVHNETKAFITDKGREPTCAQRALMWIRMSIRNMIGGSQNQKKLTRHLDLR